jgi:hypothetical protein
MSETVRLNVQLWDAERKVRMSIHRDAPTKGLKDLAGELVGQMLYSFIRSAKGEEKSRNASTAQPALSYFLNRKRRKRTKTVRS